MGRQHRDAAAQVARCEKPRPRAACGIRDLQVESAHLALCVDETGCEADVLVGGAHASPLELDCGADIFSAGGDPVALTIPKRTVHDEGTARHDDRDGQKKPPAAPARIGCSIGAEVEMLRLAHRPSMSSLQPDRSRRLGTLQL